MNKILIFCFILIFMSCTTTVQNEVEESDDMKTDTIQSEQNQQSIIQDVHYTLFKTDTVLEDKTEGWGYDVFTNGKLVIRQPHVPAVAGMKTFSDKQDASRVAELVIYKLVNNIMPPTVSINELDSLEIHR